MPKTKAADLRIHTRKEFIDLELSQSHEFKLLVQTGQYFPNDYILNLSRELKLLGIPGAVLTGDNLCRSVSWQKTSTVFSGGLIMKERLAYPALYKV